mgnify:CR=1 FL=1
MPSRDIHLRVGASCRPKSARDHDKHELTESIEEYVEGIWRLQRELGTVGTGELARYMNVAPASVTTMLKRLRVLFGSDWSTNGTRPAGSPACASGTPDIANRPNIRRSSGIAGLYMR